MVALLVLLLHVNQVFAVKSFLFKTCESSGFCHRNRAFASNIRHAGSSYEPKYAIDASSVQLDGIGGKLVVSGTILKKLPNGLGTRLLPFQLSLIDGNNVRLQVDEEREDAHLPESLLVEHRRYNETPNWAFAAADLPLSSKEGTQFKLKKDRLLFSYGDNNEYAAELSFSPVKLTISHNGAEQFVLNDRQFLNVEHLRTKHTNTQHLFPEESDFNMFEDSFGDSKSDTIPLGPESVALDFSFRDFQHVYGIPEHADSLSLKDTTNEALPYRLYNVDIFEYETGSRMPMYGSIPLLLALKPGVSMGVFWINSADTFIDIDKSTGDTKTHWISENGVLDVMIFIGKTPQDINKSYGLVTGYTSLPQLFSLGYHQCRWNYNDENDVLAINDLFDQHQIPYDTIWLDIEYAEQKKYFTWQKDNFPDPEHMLQELQDTERNLVVIIDPHLKTGYDVSDDVVSKKITINDPTNNTYYAHCWPGESVWIDTMNPSSQAYWDYQFEYSKKNEFMGKLSTNIHIWNDMNEPSVFDGPETSSQKDNLHYGNWEHRSVHNAYGLSYHEATYNSLVKRLESTDRQRPFILTRSYFAGSQRTAAMWTGDNMSKWEYLKASIPMVLTSNVVNMPFSGADVGGFFGNPSKELLTRWYQTGIWYPFFRAHAHIDSRRREPWVPGEPYTSIIRDALRLRYSLLPTFYTAFFEASTDGSPVMKPVFYESPDNLDSYAIDDQFFLGNSGLLVKPVTEENAHSVRVYLPDTQKYYRLTNGEIGQNDVVQLTSAGHVEVNVELTDIPIFLKGGSIISRKDRPRRSSKLMSRDPYTLVIALDDKNMASGTLYIDDGESFNYQKGDSLVVDFTVTNGQILAVVAGNSPKYTKSLDDVHIEKIVLLQAENVDAISVQQLGDKWAARFGAENGNLVIKRPNLKINAPWKVTLGEHVERKVASLQQDEL